MNTALMTTEEILNILPATVNWAPLVITKGCDRWIIRYSLGTYDTLFVSCEDLKRAAEEMLKLIEKRNV